ncbi:MAG: hypothetical protein AAF353_14845, partial [Pseudomonadota bacterium]
QGGYTSAIYRLELGYEAPPEDGPDSVIAKFHSESDSVRATFEHLEIYQKEVRFYQFVDRTLALPIPHCYAAEFDSSNGDFVLLLEDLSSARLGSWEHDPLGDIKIALPELAKIHARFWGDAELQNYAWVVEPTLSPVADKMHGEWHQNLKQIKGAHDEHWPADIWRICEKIDRHWRSIMACLNQETHTLVHTDAHLGQMFFPTKALPRFYLFDWQYPCKGVAAEDVIHMLVNDLEADQRREHENALIDLYLESLTQQGIDEINRDRFWFQCRLCLIWIILMNFRTVANPDLRKTLQAEADEYGENWQDWIFGELGPVIQDWELDAAIDQAIKESGL